MFVAPLRAPLAAQGLPPAAAAVIFSDPSAHCFFDPDVMAEAFGLTRSEGAVLAALVAGRSLAQYADERGVSVNTAKSQLAAIFGKTGHTRQATLIAEAASHPVVRLASHDRKQQ